MDYLPKQLTVTHSHPFFPTATKMAVGSSESLCKVSLRNRFLWATYLNSSLSLTPILPANHDYDIGSQQTPNKPNHQAPATTPAHENMNAANVDLGNLMHQRLDLGNLMRLRQRRCSSDVAQMQVICGSDAGHMRLRCGSDAAQMRLRCGSASAAVLVASAAGATLQQKVGGVKALGKKWKVSENFQKKSKVVL